MTTAERSELDVLLTERAKTWQAFQAADKEYEAARRVICGRDTDERRDAERKSRA